MEKRCYGCMKLKTQSPVCEHCGFSEERRNQPHQLPAGTVLHNQYLVGRVLGQGGFGITYLGLDLNLDVPVAIKEYYPGGIVSRDQTCMVSDTSGGKQFLSGMDRFLREAKILAKLKDVSEIVKVHNFFEENGTAYIVMEYLEGLDLRSYLRRLGRLLTPQETFALLRPIMRGLQQVHEQGLVHRDISPDNIMLQSNGRITLLDFGTARSVDASGPEGQLTHSTQAVLKYGFAPMEQYQSNGNLGPWTDVYALCATAYYCMTGKVPPDAPARITEEPLIGWDKVPGLSPAESAAMEKGMALRVKDRFASIAELEEALFRSPVVTKEPEQKPKKKKTKWYLAAALAVAVLGGCAAFFTMGGASDITMKKDPAAVTEAPVPAATEIPAVQPVRETTPKKEETPAETIAPETAPPETTEPRPMEAWEKNVLMEDPGYDPKALVQKDPSKEVNTKVFGSRFERSWIHAIYFVDTLEGTELKQRWDVSQAQDGSVMAWTRKMGQSFDLYIGAEGGVCAPESCRDLFNSYSQVKEIHFDGNFHTDKTTDFSDMFYACKSLRGINLDTFNTSRATTMKGMFSYCNELKELDVMGFDTSNVTNMSNMFNGCTKVTDLEIRGFDMRNVRNISGMFSNCESLAGLDLSNFDTSGVQNMSSLFAYCKSMKSLDLSMFDTSNVQDMSWMFAGCDQLANLDLSAFDTSNVTSMSGMFYQLGVMKELSLPSFDTSKVRDMSQMFAYCRALQKLDLSTFDTSKVTSFYNAFENSYGLKHLKLPNGNVVKYSSDLISWETLFEGTWSSDAIHAKYAPPKVQTSEYTGTRTTEEGIRITGEDLSVECDKLGRVTILVSGMQIRDTYPVNLSSSMINSVEYAWGLEFKGSDVQSVATVHFAKAPGEERLLSTYSMQNGRWRDNNGESENFDRANMKHTGDTITWYFTPKEQTALDLSAVTEITVFVYDPKQNINIRRVYTIS